MGKKPESVRWEAMWRLAGGPLVEESRAALLVDSIRAVIPAVLREYDLNRRGQWRPFHEAALQVDVVTQRTQVVEIVGDEEAVVMIATGKHGERPQAIGRWSEPGEPGQRVEAVREAAGEMGEISLELFLLRPVGAAPRFVVACGEMARQVAEVVPSTDCVDEMWIWDFLETSEGPTGWAALWDGREGE
jgi:hypothetical protein